MPIRLIATNKPSVPTPGRQTRPVSAATLRLRRACAATGLTQAELGKLIGVDDRGVRKRLRERAYADRLDLLCAIEALLAGKNAA